MTRLLPALILSLALTHAPVAQAGLNHYEWLAVAPIVVVGRSGGVDGKFVRLRVQDVLRGEVEPGSELRVLIQRANRERDRALFPRALRLEENVPYLVLLEPAPVRKKDRGAFALVRGIGGVRALPAEGAEATIEGARRFVEIQALGDDRLVWSRMAELLEETRPMLIETALDAFIKFRRGHLDLLPSVRPLLDHPAPLLREQAATLIGQILDRHGGSLAVEDEAQVRNELVARARRDSTVPVRIAATQALTYLDGAAVGTILEEIARDDPDQNVRYVAEKLIHQRGTEANRELAETPGHSN